jgi:hypothetical protein
MPISAPAREFIPVSAHRRVDVDQADSSVRLVKFLESNTCTGYISTILHSNYGFPQGNIDKIYAYIDWRTYCATNHVAVRSPPDRECG